MKSIVFYLFLAVSFCFFNNEIYAQTWREFRHFEGKFRVLTPAGEMTEKLMPIKTEVGELIYHQFVYKPTEKSAENVFYLVNYCDYPKGSFPVDSVDLVREFLETTVQSAAESVSGKVIYADDVQMEKYKGKIWRVSYNQDKASIKSKCFLVGDRFYLIQTMMTKDKVMNAASDKFFDSFFVF